MKTITAAATIITEENVLKKVNRIAPSQESLRNVQRNKAVFFFFLQVNRHRRQKEKEKKKEFRDQKGDELVRRSCRLGSGGGALGRIFSTS